MLSSLDANQTPHKDSGTGRSGRPWFKRREAQSEPVRPARHSTFPNPGGHTEILPQPFTPSEDTRWLLAQVRRLIDADRERTEHAKHRAAAIPGAPAGSHPGYLLHYLAILALDLEVIPKLTFCEAVERLRMTMEEFSARARAEQTLKHREPGHVEAVRRVGETMDAAAAAAVQLERFTGEPVDLKVDPGALASGMATLAGNASNPLEETMHALPVITKGMPDPRLAKPVEAEVTQVLPSPLQFPPFGQDNGHTHPEVTEPESPVHALADRAPLPAGGPSEAAPLPQRHPRHVVSFPAVMVGELGDAALRDGTLMVAKRLVEGHEGMWILHEDGVNWVLIADVSASKTGKTVFVKLADGRKFDVHPDREVPVLSADEAEKLLAEHAQSGGAA